jgi:hypothetical protein
MIKEILFVILFLTMTLPPAISVAADQRIAAAEKVASGQPLCQKISPFYWEIGDQSGVLASGTTGDGSVTGETILAIASASKWVFGAYVVQKLNGKIDAVTEKYLKMMAGFTHLNPMSCIFTKTIADCFNKGDNSQYSKADDTYFFYNGGHFQKWAVDHGLGNFERPQMVAEYQRLLGDDFKFSFGVFQLAGGLKTSAKAYGLFLRKILRGQLLIKTLLGANATCTLPRDCPQARRSPVREAWHYSYGHWVEDNPNGGDGSFSSPGAFGFYPWIDSTKTYYGIISRHQKPDRGSGEIGEGQASALCGQLIRKAFITGKVQNSMGK